MVYMWYTIIIIAVPQTIAIQKVSVQSHACLSYTYLGGIQVCVINKHVTVHSPASVDSNLNNGSREY